MNSRKLRRFSRYKKCVGGHAKFIGRLIDCHETNVTWSASKSRRSKSNHAERSNWNYLKKSNKKTFHLRFRKKLIALYRWSLRSLIPENHENTRGNPINEPDRWIDVNRQQELSCLNIKINKMFVKMFPSTNYHYF